MIVFSVCLLLFCCSSIDFFFLFFFSSRRRHTRLTCDWSSDVCSSDLLRHPLTETGATDPGGTGCVARSTMFFFSACVLSWRLQAPESATAPMQMLIRILRFMYGCLRNLASRKCAISIY